jgi:hypothetical protein
MQIFRYLKLQFNVLNGSLKVKVLIYMHMKLVPA